MVEALADKNAENRQRASLGLYASCEPKDFAAIEHAGPAIRRAIQEGDLSAANLLLLSYFPGDETERVLGQIHDDSQANHTKLKSWSPVVPTPLPAIVSLSALGDAASRKELLTLIESADNRQLMFLLDTLREVDSPKVLHALKRCLENKTETNAGVPAGAEPRRRFCDLAVDAFVKRLGLKVSFELVKHGRYGEKQIAEVRNRIDTTLPK